MGFLQDNLWDNIFRYAYPITFISTMFFSFIHAFDIEPLSIISNGKFLFALNLFVGLCALISFGAWYHVDLSVINPATSLIDLNANQTISDVITSN
jgi:hypothetical protein